MSRKPPPTVYTSFVLDENGIFSRADIHCGDFTILDPGLWEGIEYMEDEDDNLPWPASFCATRAQLVRAIVDRAELSALVRGDDE
jgi:hypothetical protein